MARVRIESPSDREAVRALNARAFDGPTEATIVDTIRAAGGVTLSLVAEDDAGDVVGHILFSPVTIERDGTLDASTAVGLAPMAVAPAQQHRGIGSALVREGLVRLREAGFGAVIVLGHPDYYARFGFTRASELGLRSEFDAPDDAFMALELRPCALGSAPGVVHYRPEFRTG